MPRFAKLCFLALSSESMLELLEVTVVNQERFSERVVFHVTPSLRARINDVVDRLGRPPSDSLRLLMEEIVERYERNDTGEQMGLGEAQMASVESELAQARAEVRGLQEINRLLNERLGMADAQNVELNKRLEAALSTVERVTLALPAAGESSGARGWNWKFWRR